MKQKTIALILAVLCLCCCIPMNTEAAAPSGIAGNGTGGVYIDINAAPYTDYANIANYGQYAYTTSGCAWFASARAKQLTGRGTTIYSGYNFWYNNYNLFGHGKGSVPVAKSLACYSNHVAVVEAVNGNQLLISEGGNTTKSAANGYCSIEWKTAPTVGVSYGTSGVFYGYVYMGPVNAGDDFYAYMIKSDTWNHLGAVNGNVEIVNQNTTTDGADGWHFVRQSDGSYYIYNWKDGKALTAAASGTANGTNVVTATYTGASNQKWYVYGSGNGDYSLKAAYVDKVIDLDNNGSAVGTNAQLWENNGTSAQKFNLYKIDCVGSSVVSAEAGTSSTATQFTWTRGEYATGYNLSIQTVSSSGALSAYKTVSGLTDTSYSLVLPAGDYAVSVESYNYDYQKTSDTVYFTVKAVPKELTVKTKYSSYTYTGSAIKPAVTVYADGEVLDSSLYTVSYKNNKSVGTATITVTGTGEYAASSGTKTFKIVKPKAFSDVTLSKTSYVYNGSARKPTVTVYVKGKKISSSNYTVTYKNNKNVGTATVTVTGKGNYSLCKTEVTFKITPKEFTKVTLSKTSYTYTGKSLKPTASVYVGSTKLASKYYKVSYKNNVNAGTATVTITGQGKYSNYKSVTTFKIKPKAFTKVSLSSSKYAYNGNAKKPTVTVYVGSTKISSSYYTVSYKNNTEIGTATVTITGKGKYSNYKSTKTFKIVPAKQKITSIATNDESGKIYVTHTLDTQATGYQVQISTSSSFDSIAVKGTFAQSEVSWYAYNLQSSKTYYVRVRSYKTVDGTKYYGAWSPVKSIKTK